MSHSSSKNTNLPFKNLANLLKERNIALESRQIPRKESPPYPPPATAANESDLFKEAMADVKPITSNKTGTFRERPTVNPALMPDDDREISDALTQLVRDGHGFVVSLTPEYMESANPGASTEVLRRLHQGRYAIQDHVDLHGLRVHEAEQVLERFIYRSIENNLRAVLIVHGRGLSSPREPVLKEKVFFWLTRGHLRKWVIALTSARSCDGGAGATYVLLRRRPMTKSKRRKHTPKSNC